MLGLGAGWNETEFRAFGIPFDHRASHFGESFEIIRRLLAGERVTYEGRFESVARRGAVAQAGGPSSADDRLDW